MRLMNSFVRLGFLVGFSALLFACAEDSRYARLEIRLTDAPGDYEEVNVDIQEIQVHSESGGWQSISTNAGIYNLLDLTNGLDTIIGTAELPAGRVSQIRLILGENNTIKLDGITTKLSTPSAQQSGLKLNVHADLIEGITYTILLDFDAARSVVKAGASGKYNLKPVIRAITQATSGAIAGTVSIPVSSPAVYAIIGADTLGTTFANDEGKFMIMGLNPNTYTVSFNPAEGYTIDDITDVAVTIGNVTNLGVIEVKEE